MESGNLARGVGLNLWISNPSSPFPIGTEDILARDSQG